MRNTVITIIGLLIFFSLIKFFLVGGGIAALVASGYFIYQAVRDKKNRQFLLKKRVLPALVALVLCFSFVGTFSGKQHSSQHENRSAQTSQQHAESSSSKDDSDGDSEDADDTDAEADTSDESSERAEATEIVRVRRPAPTMGQQLLWKTATRTCGITVI